MRAVLHQDIVALARCLLRLPEAEWRGFARRKILLADAADRYRARTGKAHPSFGDGTLSGALRGCRRDRETALDRGRYGRCLEAALAEVLRFREAHPLAHERQSGTVGSCASRAGSISSPQSGQ